MPVFGTQMFGSGGPLAGTVDQTDTFGNEAGTAAYTFTGVDFGTGGKLVIGFGANYRSSQVLSSWTADGNTITTRTSALNSENIIYIGTVDVGSATSGTLVITINASIARLMGHVWDVSNVDLTNPDSTPTADKSWDLTYGTISATGIAVALGYDQDGGITGATGLDYDGEATAGASGAGGASKAFATAESSYSFNFDGSRHADGSGVAGLSLPPV